jgi:hypothetical protein
MFGKDTTVTYEGVTYTFSSRMEWGYLKRFFAWIAEQEGDVFTDLERFIDRIPEAERAALFKERQDRRDQIKSLNLDSPIAQQYKQTPEGVGYMAAALLAVKHPDITPERAWLIMQSLDPAVAMNIKRMADEANKSRLKNASAPA